MDDCRREFVNDLGLRLSVGVDTGCVGGVGRPVDNGEGYAENDVCRGAVAGPGLGRSLALAGLMTFLRSSTVAGRGSMLPSRDRKTIHEFFGARQKPEKGTVARD